ncbi:DUF7519 family protein [Halogranum rubrum]|uniref:DUF7519 family protein n=1 Tax=Halogranum rubrum TaxID=553466 RepID=UPI00116033C2|nr:hypothetical protein [Halogranum rubrum]
MTRGSREFETTASRFGASLALVVAAVAAFVLVASTGELLRGLVGVGGAVLVGRSAKTLDTRSNEQRAVGSLGVVVGSALLVGAVAVTDVASVLVAVAAFAVMAVALDATTGLDEDTGQNLFRTLIHSSVAVGILTVVTASIALGLPAALVAWVAEVGETVVRSSDFAAFVSVQIGVLLVSLLLARALPRLDRWTPDAWLPEQRELLGHLATEPWEVPRWVLGLLGVQVVVALGDGGGHLFATLLDLTAVFGDVFRFLLHSGVVHVPLAVVLAVLGGIVLADYLRGVLVVWAGDDPPETLAHASGGVAVGVALGVLTAVPMVATLVTAPFHPESSAAALTQVFGLGTTLLGSLVAALVAVLAVVGTALSVTNSRYIPPEAGGFAIGSGLLFVAALVGTVSSVPPFVTFVAVGAALLVWDLGENAVGLGRQLGVDAETRRGEVVHTTGSALAVGVGIVVAVVAMYGLGPLSVPSGGRALLALVLALVALLAFVAAIDRTEGHERQE